MILIAVSTFAAYLVFIAALGVSLLALTLGSGADDGEPQILDVQNHKGD